MGKLFKDEKVGDIYKRLIAEPKYVKPGTPLSKVADIFLSDLKRRTVFVVDQKMHVVGAVMLSTVLKHVAYRAGVRGKGAFSFIKFLAEILSENVEDVMIPVETITPEDTIEKALMIVVNKGILDIPVVDNAGMLIGELNGIEILAEGKRLLK
ncbi:MAG: CBS domain-containing protein [Thermoplasmata archaeon]